MKLSSRGWPLLGLVAIICLIGSLVEGFTWAHLLMLAHAKARGGFCIPRVVAISILMGCTILTLVLSHLRARGLNRHLARSLEIQAERKLCRFPAPPLPPVVRSTWRLAPPARKERTHGPIADHSRPARSKLRKHQATVSAHSPVSNRLRLPCSAFRPIGASVVKPRRRGARGMRKIARLT